MEERIEMSKTSLKGENIGKEDLSPMEFSESESSTMHFSSTTIPLFSSLHAHEQQNSTILQQNARPSTSQIRRSATYRSQRVAKKDGINALAPKIKDHDNNSTKEESSLKLQQRLTEAKLMLSKSFIFNQTSLCTIHPDIGTLSHLTEINFSFNKLCSLPESIANLPLKSLNLSQNLFKEIPSVVLCLSSLTQLNMSGNQISTLPLEIGKLVTLEQLHLGNNLLSTLPTSIGDLVNLTILQLQSNKFTALPTTIGRMKSLTSLFLQDNSLACLPSELCQLGSLTTLCVQNNHLNCLPPSLGTLKQMWCLNVSYNFLNTFPSSLGRLSKTLTDFIYHKNPLQHIPQFLHNDPKSLLLYLEKEFPPDVTVSSLVLPHDLNSMVNGKAFSDLTAIVEGREIHLHKCILYARRSRYYEAKVFPSSESVVDSSISYISISEISLSLFSEIIEYIYTGNSLRIRENPLRFKDYLVNVEMQDESISYEELSSDLKALHGNPKFSDISFTIDGKSIPAHKTIICCRCSPMAAMFTNSHFPEFSMRSVPVHDVSFDIFKDMMEFIYTGRCSISGDNATELLVVANFYQLQRLKEMCEKAIESGVDEQNRVQLLQFSNLYQAMQLEELCAHGIVKMKDKEFKRFISSDEYKQLNDDIKSLIKRKRDKMTGVFLEYEEDLKKNKLEETTHDTVTNKTYVNKIAYSNSVFNYQGTLDFDFNAKPSFQPFSASNFDPSVPLIERLERVSASSRPSHRRHRRRKSRSSKGELEISSELAASASAFPFVAVLK